MPTFHQFNINDLRLVIRGEAGGFVMLHQSQIIQCEAFLNTTEKFLRGILNSLKRDEKTGDFVSAKGYSISDLSALQNILGLLAEKTLPGEYVETQNLPRPPKDHALRVKASREIQVNPNLHKVFQTGVPE